MFRADFGHLEVQKSEEETIWIYINLHAPLIQGLFHHVGLVKQPLWDRLCHLPIVGELDRLGEGGKALHSMNSKFGLT